MKNYLKGIATGIFIGTSVLGYAQDIHFSQFYDNSILRNPALTGIFSGEYKVGVDYRSQWASISTPYTTVAASAESRFLINRNTGDYLSVGLGAYYDKAGSINFTSEEVYPSLALNKAINDKHNSYLSVGFAGGYLTRNVDMSKMTFSSQYNFIGGYSATNPSGEIAPFNSLHVFDVGAGVSFNSSLDLENRANYYVGGSVYHINRPNEIFNSGYTTVKLPMKYQFNAGINLVLSSRISFAVHANVADQKPSRESLVGGLLTYHSYSVASPSVFAFSFGAFYRTGDAIIPTVKLDFSNVSVGFSYDVTNSSLATGSSGTSATEVSIFVRGKYLHRTNPRDGIMCPRFEQEIYYPFSN